MTAASGAPRLVRQVGVVVPARDEEAALPSCLAALAAAAAHARDGAGVGVDVVVVLDRCVDDSAAVVARWPAVVAVEVDAGNVGRARAAGFDRLTRGGAPPDLWLATTDADSVVPRDWLSVQVEHARAGADLVLGTVDVVDWSPHPREVEERWRAAYDVADGHPHVHGANVGFSAAAYRDVGGFAHLDRDEDVALAAALAHRRVVRTGAIPVLTSARAHARARGGFADHLRSLRGLGGVVASAQASQGNGSTKVALT